MAKTYAEQFKEWSKSQEKATAKAATSIKKPNVLPSVGQSALVNPYEEDKAYYQAQMQAWKNIGLPFKQKEQQRIERQAKEIAAMTQEYQDSNFRPSALEAIGMGNALANEISKVQNNAAQEREQAAKRIASQQEEINALMQKNAQIDFGISGAELLAQGQKTADKIAKLNNEFNPTLPATMQRRKGGKTYTLNSSNPQDAQTMQRKAYTDFLTEKMTGGAGNVFSGASKVLIDSGQDAVRNMGTVDEQTTMRLRDFTKELAENAQAAGKDITDKQRTLEKMGQADVRQNISYNKGLDAITQVIRDNNVIAKTVDSYVKGIDERYNNPTGLYKLGGDVASGVGQMIPSIASNIIWPGSGMAVLASSAAGSAAEEARNEGASDDIAFTYGVLSGGVEIATEKLFDGIPGLQGKTAVDGILTNALKKTAWSNAGQNLVKKLVDVAGEGVEEYISEVAGAYLKKLYNEDERDVITTFIETQPDAVYAGFVGALTSAVMNGGNFAKIGADGVNAAKNGAIAKKSGAANDIISAGLASGQQDVQQKAQRMAQTVLDGGELSSTQIGDLMQDIQQSKFKPLPMPSAEQQAALQSRFKPLPMPSVQQPDAASRFIPLPMRSAEQKTQENKKVWLLPGLIKKTSTDIEAKQEKATINNTVIDDAKQGHSAAQQAKKGTKKETYHVPSDAQGAPRLYVQNEHELVSNKSIPQNSGKTSAQTAQNAQQGDMPINTAQEQKAMQVGKATKIYKPYTDGEVPKVMTDSESVQVEIADKHYAQAKNAIAKNKNQEQFKAKITKAYRELLKNKLKQEVIVKGTSFNEKAYAVTINHNVIGKVISDRNLSAEKIAILSSLDSVVENASYVGSGEVNKAKESERQTIRYDYFETEAKINGQEYVVSFDVRVLPGKNNYRTHKVINKIDLQKLSGGEFAPAANAQDNFASHTNSIPQTPQNTSGQQLQTGVQVDGQNSQKRHESAVRNMIVAHPIINGVSNTQTAGSILRAEKAAEKLYRQAKQYADAAQATQSEWNSAKRVASGEITLEDIGRRDRADRVQEMANLLTQSQEAKSRGVQAVKKDIWAFQTAKFKGILSDLMTPEGLGVKAVGKFALNARTPERVLRKQFGQDMGDKLINEVIKPIHKNESSKIQVINELYNQARALELSEVERMLTQVIGEQVKGPSGKVLTVEDVAKGVLPKDVLPGYMSTADQKLIVDGMAKADATKVQNAVNYYTKTYKEMHSLVNEFRVSRGLNMIGKQENYFPHFTEDDFITKTMKSLGIDGVSNLPTSISGKTADRRPNSRFVRYFQERTGQKTKFDSDLGFQMYVNNVMDMIYHTDDIMKLRTLDAVLRGERKDLDMEGVVDSILTKKNLKLTVEEQTYIDKVLEGEYMDMEADEAYSNFASWLTQYTNKLANKQLLMDRATEDALGRVAMNLPNKLASKYGANAVVGNVSSALNNTITLPKILATSEEGDFLRAVQGMVTGEFKAMDIAGQSEFLLGKKGITPVVMSQTQRASKAVMDHLFDPIEQAVSEVAFYTKYVEQTRKGADQFHAIETANDYAAYMMSRRTAGAKPLFFESKNPVVKLVTMFQNEVSNDFYSIKDEYMPAVFQAIKQKEGGKAALQKLGQGMAKYVAYACAMNTIREFLGMQPAAPDLARWIFEFFRDLYTIEEDENTFDNVMGAIGGAGKNIGGQVPMVSSALALMGKGTGRVPLPDYDLPKIGSGVSALFEDVETTPNKYGYAAQQLWNGVGVPTAMWMLPFGGNQTKKTLEGANVMLRGGMYSQTEDGERLQTVINNNPATVQGAANWAKALVFGKSAPTEVRNYWDGDRKMLTTQQTETYKKMKGNGLGDAYLDHLQLTCLSDSEMAKGLLQAEDLTDKEKSVLFDNYVKSATKKQQHQKAKAYRLADLYLDVIANAGNEKGNLTQESVQNYLMKNVKDTDKQAKMFMILYPDASNLFTSKEYQQMHEQGAETQYIANLPIAKQSDTKMAKQLLDLEYAENITKALFGAYLNTDKRKQDYAQAQENNVDGLYIDVMAYADTNDNGTLTQEEVRVYLQQAAQSLAKKKELYAIMYPDAKVNPFG